MFLNCPSQTLEVSFRAKHGEGQYMVYTSTGSTKCFECGDVGHKRTLSSQAGRRASRAGAGGAAKERTRIGGPPGEEVAEAVAAWGAGVLTSEPEAGEGHSGQADSQAGDQKAFSGGVGSVEVVEAAAAAETDSGESTREGPAGEPGQCQAAAAKVGAGEPCARESDTAKSQEEEMRYDTDSDCVSVTDSQLYSGDLYILEEINGFLDETFGKSVKVSEFFPDSEKFIKSVLTLQKVVGVDLLDDKKRFRLRKHMTSLRKAIKTRGKGSKRSRLYK